MKITFLIIGICIVVFFAQSATGGMGGIVSKEFSLTPNMALSGHIWQFVTYMFLHGDTMHLFLNMIGLLIFGFVVESAIGRKKYLILFFISGIASSMIFLGITAATTTGQAQAIAFSIPMLGASGAVFGIMAAYGLLYPKNWIIMFPGIPMPAWVAVIVFAGLEIFYGLSGIQPGIANWGHLGGLVIGAILILYWKKRGSKKHNIIIEDGSSKNKKDEWEYVWE